MKILGVGAGGGGNMAGMSWAAEVLRSGKRRCREVACGRERWQLPHGEM